MGKQWTKEEDSYLMELYEERTDDGGVLPPSIITILFNEHFGRTRKYLPRTHEAVSSRTKKLLREGYGKHIKTPVKKTKQEQQIDIMRDRVHEDFKLPKYFRPNKQGKTGPESNSGKGWPPADDTYLIKHFTSDEKQQHQVAKHLGRSVKACKSRINRIRKTDNYLDTVMRANSQISIIKSGSRLTLLDKIYLYFKYRKEAKIKRKRNKLEKKLERLK